MTENQIKAASKIKEEAKAEKAGAERVAAEMARRFAEEPQLAEKYIERGITLKAIWAYIEGEARKKAVGGCACIEDDEVLRWAVHFIIDGKPAEEPKKAVSEENGGSEDEEGDEDPVELREPKKEPKPEKKEKKREFSQMSLFDFMGE